MLWICHLKMKESSSTKRAGKINDSELVIESRWFAALASHSWTNVNGLTETKLNFSIVDSVLLKISATCPVYL